MTREEIIEMVKTAFDVWENEYDTGDDWSKEHKARDMAIKALEQQPIITSTEDNAEMTYPQVEGIMPTVALPDVDKDFQIGDEVRIIGSDPIYDDCDVGWVIRNASERDKTMYVMRNDGSAGEEAKAEWYKTGRHNAMLAEVIKALPSVTQKSGKWIEDILDKIRAEIERKAHSGQWSDATMYGMLKAVAIIDKYKAESEDKE